MTLENTLQELAERRLAFKAYRTQVEEELRQLRTEKLAAEQSSIEHIVVKAMAEGATLGQVKKAYGTKDHRTISTMVANRASEIQAVRDAKVEESKTVGPDWYFLRDDGTFRIIIGEQIADYDWFMVDDLMMFNTEENPWNDDYSIRNEAVALLNGKTETDSPEAKTIASAIRARQD